MKSDNDIIRLESLGIGYGKRPVAADITACIDRPQVVALIGPNGAGKSTLLKTMSGELRHLSGHISLMGKPLDEYTRRDMSHMLSLVTTDADSLAGGLTVRELVSLGRQPYTGFFGRLSTSDRRMVEEAMENTGISHKAGSFVATLSDGERQKAMIARALAQNTPVLFLDEPFSFLDPAARIEIFMMLRREVREHGKTIVLSTHDVAQALRMADDIWMLGHGIFRRSSPASEFPSDDLTRLFGAPGVTFSTRVGDFVPESFVNTNH